MFLKEYNVIASGVSTGGGQLPPPPLKYFQLPLAYKQRYYYVSLLTTRAETRQCSPPPRNHLSGPPKNFSWMVIQKSEPRRGDVKLGGPGGMPPPRKFCGI